MDTIYQIDDNLYLIDLPMKIRGFRKFISSWVIKNGKEAILVDVGPAATVRTLYASLKWLGIEKVDYVFLTHIHLDHAGGIGHLIRLYPSAKVIVHRKGVKHLIDPSRLWDASKRVLGDLALKYGQIIAVPPENISSEIPVVFDENVKVLETPGHAPHHQSYLVGDWLFAGDSCGVYLNINETYLRPATPPRFFKDIYERSLRLMLELGKKKLCFAHFGMHNDSSKIIKEHFSQIQLWTEVVKKLSAQCNDINEIVDSAIQELIKRDRLFLFNELDEDIKEREYIGVKNSILSIYQFVKEARI